MIIGILREYVPMPYGIGYAYDQYQSLGFEVNADKCIFTLFSYHHYQVCQQF